jgi:hypothetical protein
MTCLKVIATKLKGCISVLGVYVFVCLFVCLCPKQSEGMYTENPNQNSAEKLPVLDFEMFFFLVVDSRIGV